MQIQVERVDAVTVVAFSGESLDARNVADFKQEIAPVLESDLKLVFDFSSLGFIDSSGLGALLSCLRITNQRGGLLKLCGATKGVRLLFELVNLHKIFEIYNDRREALASY